MTSHFGLMVVFALFVATVFATIAKDTPKEQVRFGLKLFGGFVGVGIGLGWVMRAFPI